MGGLEKESDFSRWHDELEAVLSSRTGLQRAKTASTASSELSHSYKPETDSKTLLFACIFPAMWEWVMAVSLAMFFSCLMKTNFQALRVAEWRVGRRSWPGVSHQGLRVFCYLPKNLTAPAERAAMGGYRLFWQVSKTSARLIVSSSTQHVPNFQSDVSKWPIWWGHCLV